MADDYDVVVVGAGIAGLIAANFLASEGQRVLVLEHNHQAGGLIAGIWRKGHYFDCGAPSFQNMGAFFPLLKELGVYRPEDWQRSRYRFVTGDGRIDRKPQGLGDLYELIAPLHRGEPGDLRRYVSVVEEVAEAWREVELVGLHIAFRQAPSSAAMRCLDRWFKVETDTFLKRYFREDTEIYQRLRHLGYAGEPAAIHMAWWHWWLRDYWQHARGMEGLVQTLVDRFVQAGGALTCKSQVTALSTAGGRVVAVTDEHGGRFGCRGVVYTGDHRRLYGALLDPSEVPSAVRARVEGMPLTTAVATVYIGADLQPEEAALRLPTAHTWFFPESDPRLGINVIHTSLDRPELAPPGRSSLAAQITVPSAHALRGEHAAGYRDDKRAFEATTLAILGSLVPGIGNRVVFADVGTPRATERFTLNTAGATSGWHWGMFRGRYRIGDDGFQTPVGGLHVAGHYTFPYGGFAMAAWSGKHVAQRLLAELGG